MGSPCIPPPPPPPPRGGSAEAAVACGLRARVVPVRCAGHCAQAPTADSITYLACRAPAPMFPSGRMDEITLDSTKAEMRTHYVAGIWRDGACTGAGAALMAIAVGCAARVVRCNLPLAAHTAARRHLRSASPRRWAAHHPAQGDCADAVSPACRRWGPAPAPTTGSARRLRAAPPPPPQPVFRPHRRGGQTEDRETKGRRRLQARGEGSEKHRGGSPESSRGGEPLAPPLQQPRASSPAHRRAAAVATSTEVTLGLATGAPCHSHR